MKSANRIVEKIKFVNQGTAVSDQGLVSETSKGLNTKKTTPLLKQAKDLSRYFSRKDLLMANDQGNTD